MPLNTTQTSILQLAESINIQSKKDELIEAFISKLELKTGQTFVRDENSNIYILTEVFVDEIIKYKLEYITLLSSLNSFFDTNKFTGYAGSDYYGLRSAILNLSFFNDCKISVVKEGIINIIALLKNDLTVDTIKQQVAKTIHEYIAIGIKTYESETDQDATFQEVMASNGQALKYAFYLAKVRNFNFKITYFLDYEEDNIEYDMVATINNAITNIYNQYYNKIGKDLKIQDFYSITLTTAGLGRISIEIDEVNNNEETINTYTNTDVTINTKEIFTLNKLDVIGGSNV